MGRGKITQILVVSPYFDAEWLAAELRQGTRNTVVSSCLLLPSETVRLRQADPLVEVTLLSEFFDDAILGRHDEELATAIDDLARDARAAELVSLAYNDVFMRGVGTRRNRAVARQLRAQLGAVARLVVSAGPNITVSAWRETFPEAVFVCPPPPVKPPAATPAAVVTVSPPVREGGIYLTNSLAALGRTRLLGAEPPCRFLEMAGLGDEISGNRLQRYLRPLRWPRELFRIALAQRRLRARLDVAEIPADIDRSPLRAICTPKLLRRLARLLDIVADARRRGARAMVFSMHGFSPLDALAARLAGLKCVVLQDGYLPVNYPRSVYGPYRGSTFVFWSEASQTWGNTVGLDGPICQPCFPRPAPYNRAAPPADEARVLVLLGTGGEWTSLIFRSDVDALVRDIVETARLRPAVQFRLRAHPTMLAEIHDGWNSLDRLRLLVAESNVHNVSFSTGTLDAEFDWATFAVSEYSLTLLEFVARNPGGIATLNPTHRRDFFQEFTRLGVPHATTPAELASLLDRLPLDGRRALAPWFEPPARPRSIAEVLGELAPPPASPPS